MHFIKFGSVTMFEMFVVIYSHESCVHSNFVFHYPPLFDSHHGSSGSGI